jgi:hypothetical protein
MERPVVAGSSNSGAACPHLIDVTGRILGTFVRRVNRYRTAGPRRWVRTDRDGAGLVAKSGFVRVPLRHSWPCAEASLAMARSQVPRASVSGERVAAPSN